MILDDFFSQEVNTGLGFAAIVAIAMIYQPVGLGANRCRCLRGIYQSDHNFKGNAIFYPVH